MYTRSTHSIVAKSALFTLKDLLGGKRVFKAARFQTEFHILQILQSNPLELTHLTFIHIQNVFSRRLGCLYILPLDGRGSSIRYPLRSCDIPTHLPYLPHKNMVLHPPGDWWLLYVPSSQISIRETLEGC